MARVIVVGAGVVGLTCAVRLLEDGHRVDVLARDLPLETTSAVAAAIWYPYRAFPFDRVLAWSARSYEAFAGWRTSPAPASRCDRASRSSPRRRTTRGGGRPSRASTTWPPPAGTATRGPSWRRWSRCRCTCAWLAARVEELGGTITRLNLSALPVGPDVVVNCCRARRAAARRGPRRSSRCAARSCTCRAGRAGAVVRSTRPRRPDVRRAPRARHRGRRHRRGG